MEPSHTQAVFVANWVPVSPNRTQGRHWSVKHRHRKQAGKAWIAALAANQDGLHEIKSARLSLSGSTSTPGSLPAGPSTATTTSRVP